MTNEKLKETLSNAVVSQAETTPDLAGEDVLLTDADLDDVAGGCVAMCGKFSVGAE